MFMLDCCSDSKGAARRAKAFRGNGFPLARYASASTAVLAASGVLLCAFPLSGQAAPPLSAGTLPNRPGANSPWTPPVVTSGSASYAISGNTGTITQTTPRAILNWQTFNIANDSQVRFNQPGAASVALNRVLDPTGNPSVIQGKLSANGQVYLINQNGILFDKSAQIDVNALVASALNISDKTFNNGLFPGSRNTPTFSWEGDQAGFLNSLVRVENGAQINAANGGFVMLLGPRVENAGAIATPGGQTTLAAGARVYLGTVPGTKEYEGLHGFLVEVDPYQGADANGKPTAIGGTATNDLGGLISAPRGNVTLVGFAVNQSGRISATTSVNQNGYVRLVARDSVNSDTIPTGTRTGAVVMGKDSRIEILPENDKEHIIQDAQTFYPSTVEVMGSGIRFEENSSIHAPGGVVNVSAQQSSQFGGAGQPANGSRIYMAPGSVIDVAGTQDVQVAAERNAVEVDLRSSVVQDFPLVRDSALYGQKIWVDIRKGTPLADISGYVAGIGRTAAERTTEGGKVTMKSEGDAVLRDGSKIDFSGGSIDYLAGTLPTTQLISQGKLYDVSTASPNRIYDGIAGSYQVKHAKWGVTETFAGLGQRVYSPAYREGRNAGQATFVARGLVLDGTLLGKATPGPMQRDAGKMPLPGQLVIGDAAQAGENMADFATPDVTFAAKKNLLPSDFAAQDPLEALPAQFRNGVSLSTEFLSDGGIGRLAVYSNGRISVPKGVALDVTPSVGSQMAPDPANPGAFVSQQDTGRVTLVGRQVEVDGAIRAPSGSVALTSTLTRGASAEPNQFGITVGAGGEVSARGAWVNDFPTVALATGSDPLLIDGGSVALKSLADVTLAQGSLLDVSGGASVNRSGTFQGGRGGSISVTAGPGVNGDIVQKSVLFLGGELHGYGVSTGAKPAAGGTLALGASSVRIGSARAPGDLAPAGELQLDPAFFRMGGFSQYAITGQNGLTVTSGSDVRPAAANLVLDRAYVNRPGGGNVFTFGHPELLAPEQRLPASVTLASGSRLVGGLAVEQGAAIRVEPTAQVNLKSGRQLTVQGTVDAPAGSISLSTAAPGNNDDYNPDQSIWIGASARLTSTGFARIAPQNGGLRQGDVLGGGSVSINAGKGYVVAESGSVIDVSGLPPVTLDIVRQEGGRAAYVPTQVAGDAGSIAIAAREGAFLDGTLRGAPGGAGAAGGSLALTLSRPLSPNAGSKFPTGPASIVMQNAGGSIPTGLKPGDTIEIAGKPDSNGKAFVAAQSVQAGGFDTLALKSQDNIEFRGDANLALRRSIKLDAPNLVSTGGGQVQLDAAYVSLGNSASDPLHAAAAPAGGAGNLAVNAGLLDLGGASAWQGFKEGRLASTSDIRLKGVFDENAFGRDSTVSPLKGSLNIGGDLKLTANQIYPTSLSDFTLASAAPSGSIGIGQWGANLDSPVLSAGGRLTVKASNIDQAGVLKAPFGSIMLQADALRLAPGSVTSVSAEGLTIPLGRTQLSGRDYVYAFDSTYNMILSAPPEKSVRLSAGSVDVQSGATVNLAGGGDLHAYEFTPGRGGSKDVLDPANAAGAFAVLPSLKSAAPYDHQEYMSGAKPNLNLNPGDRVYLSGGAGLAAGFYTVLPARYALLDGAYLVTPVAGSRDMLASQNAKQPDGSVVVSGYRAAVGFDGSLIRDARTSGFAVAPGAMARKRSEYRDTLASSFFESNAAQMPGDAGRLAIDAGQALSLKGTLAAATGAGGRGAEVDISSGNIAIGSGGDPQAVQLDPDTLNRLGASSLLIGGTRSTTADGVTIAVGASKVTVNGGADLAAPEIILAAADQVTVKSGARLEGKGEFAGQPKDLTVNGNGALLRTSSGGQVNIVRPGSDGSAGDLNVEKGASLYAGKSLILDATRDTATAGSAIAFGDHAAFSVGARRISLGEVGNVGEGLAFSNADLAQFGKLDRLSLRSYSTVDMHGAVALGNDALNLDIQAGGIRGFQGTSRDVSIHADTLTLSNPGGVPSAGTGGSLGDGTLAATARKVVLGEGRTVDGQLRGVAIEGFDSVKLSAAGEIVGSGAGRLDVKGGDLALQATRLTGAAGARQTATATGAAAFVQAEGFDQKVLADLRQATALGAHFDLRGDSVKVDGVVDLPAGGLTAAATHDVTLMPNARLNVAGVAKQFVDTVAYAPGGSVTLTSDLGNVNIGQGALVDVSGAGGDAGSLLIRAANGEARLDGTLKGYASPDAQGIPARQGSFALDVAKLDSFSDLNARLAPRFDGAGKAVEGGFTEEVDVRVRNGDVRVASSDRVKAHTFALEADGGDIEVKGGIDASGNKGGSIGLYASGNVTVAGAALDAHATEARIETAGTAGRGGKVTLAATTGVVDVQKDTSIDVSGMGTGKGGSVLLRAPRTGAGTDVAVNLQPGFLGSVKGASDVVVEAVKTYNQGTLSTQPALGSLLIGSASDATNAAVKASWTVPLIDAVGKAVAGQLDMSDAAVQTALNDVVNSAAQAAASAILAGKNAAMAGNAAGAAAGSAAGNNTALGNVADLLTATVSGVVANSGYYTAAQKAASSAAAQVAALANSAKVRGAVLQDTYTAGATFIATAALGSCGSSCDATVLTAVETAATQALAAHGSASAVVDAIVAALPKGLPGSVKNEVREAALGAVMLDIAAARAAADGAYEIADKIVLPDAIKAETTQFAASSGNIAARLGAGVDVRPGVEIRAPGDLVLTKNLDLSGWRFDDGTGKAIEPGVLTLRAGGNLTLNGSLSDGFASASTSAKLVGGNSWSYRLAAGADLGAANPLAVRPLEQTSSPQGTLAVAPGALVRTGTGSIDMAAGGNVALGSAQSVIYTAGQPRQSVADFPNVALVTNANYPTGGGDVSIRALGDVKGAATPQLISDWLYRRGKTNADGTTIKANTNTTWWVNFPTFQENVGVLGGGDVTVTAGGNVDNLSVAIPTTGRLSGKPNTTAAASMLDVRGGGDLAVRAGKDVLGGVFYVAQGKGDIAAGGAVASGRSVTLADASTVPLHTILALGNAEMRVRAGGNLDLEAALNPTVLTQASANYSSKLGSYFFTYGADSRIGLSSVAGNVSLFNNKEAIAASAPQLFDKQQNGNRDTSISDQLGFAIYPSTLRAAALQGDVALGGSPTLFPSASGNLELLAAGSVAVKGTMTLSDIDPSRLPAPTTPFGGWSNNTRGAIDDLVSSSYHSNPPLHQQDGNPIRIYALNGDISGGKAFFPKQASLAAGRDIRDFDLHGQNLRDSDVTELSAGRDVAFTTPRDQYGKPELTENGITVGGPGRLEILAGRNVDLGTSNGIVTRGNVDNAALPDNGATIIAAAGVGGEIAYDGFATLYGVTGGQEQVRQKFFDELKQAGLEHNRGGGYDRGYKAAAALFPGDAYQGDINLFFSQIKTEHGGNIEIMAPGGQVNAGLANPGGFHKPASQLGIVTVDGGSVQGFVRDNFLVNQSRVFTLGGGDILLWSSLGNIDAGKGAKTASATPPPRIAVDPNTGATVMDTTNSVSGSGIGVLLARDGITQGEVDLIAPKGEVNAGDAGIRAAGNLNIAAARVVGAENMQFGGVAVGVPTGNASGLGAGLSGVSSLSDASKAASETTKSLSSNSSEESMQRMKQAMDEFRPSFITVEVIGLGEGSEKKE